MVFIFVGSLVGFHICRFLGWFSYFHGWLEFIFWDSMVGFYISMVGWISYFGIPLLVFIFVDSKLGFYICRFHSWFSYFGIPWLVFIFVESMFGFHIIKKKTVVNRFLNSSNHKYRFPVEIFWTKICKNCAKICLRFK